MMLRVGICFALISGYAGEAATVKVASAPGKVVRLKGAPGTVWDATGATMAGAQIWGQPGTTLRGGTYTGVDPTGKPLPNCIDVRASNGVTVEGVKMTGCAAGLTLANLTGGLVQNNIADGVRNDGFFLSSVRGVNVIGNRCFNFRPTPGAHPDCIQGTSVNGALTANVTLSGNVSDTDAQCFSFFNASPGYGGFIRIVGNACRTTHGNAISCHACRAGSEVSGNTIALLQPARPGITATKLYMLDYSQPTKVCGNLAGPGGRLTAKEAAPCL